MDSTLCSCKLSHVPSQIIAKHENVGLAPSNNEVDYAGAICMAGNVTVTSHTNHVNIRYMYLNEYVEDGIVKIVLSKSAENDSNIPTKNSMEIHMKDNHRR